MRLIDVSVSDLIAGAEGEVAAVGAGLASAGALLESAGQDVATCHPDERTWQGLSREGFVAASTWQGRSAEATGSATISAGSALVEYADAVADARGVAVHGQRIEWSGRQRYALACRAWMIAAAAANPGAAADAVRAAVAGVAEQRRGAIMQRDAAAYVERAAAEAVARLTMATEVVRAAGRTPDPLNANDGWTLADLFLAPVTIPAGLVDGVVVQPVRSVARLVDAVITDPELRHRALLAASGGPMGLGVGAAAGVSGFVADQGEQYIDAAAADGLDGVSRELVDDAVDSGRLAADAVGITDFLGGLHEGNLFRAASGAGSLADLAVGAHGAGVASRGAEFVAATASRGVDDAGTHFLDDLGDDELELIVGGTREPSSFLGETATDLHLVDIDKLDENGAVWRKDNDTLWRISHRPPDAEKWILGIRPRAAHSSFQRPHERYHDVFAHVRQASPLFVSTSRQHRAFDGFQPVPDVYIYEINAPGGVDVPLTHANARQWNPDSTNADLDGNEMIGAENEVVFPGGIRSRFIKGAFHYRQDRTAPFATQFPYELERWIPNPRYRPPG